MPKYFLATSIIPKQKQIDYWKCKISYQLITFIDKPDQFIGNSQDSFRDQIIKKINSYSEDSDGVKIAKQQIKKLFISGIKLDQNVFSHQRVKDGLSKNQNISFLSTKFSTSLIFKYFKEYSQEQVNPSNLLISGGYGISKTFSCILYSLLTNNIVSFRIKYPKSVSQLTQSILNRPKVIYWSLDLQQIRQQLDQSDQFNFLKVLKRNCPQVEQFIKQNKQDFPKWQGKQSQYFKFFKQRNIKLMFNVDQINITMSIFRKVKYYQSQLQKLQKQQQIQKDVQKIKQINDKIFDCRQKFRININKKSICLQIVNNIKFKYRKFFQNIFLSNRDINRFQWETMNITGSENHTMMDHVEIHYLRQINNPQVLQQIIDFYIFAFGQKAQLNEQQLKNWYKETNVSGQEFLILRRRLRKALFNQILKQKGYFYLNLLSINKYFESQYSSLGTQKLRKPKDNQTDYHFNVLYEKLLQHLPKCQQYSYNDFRGRVEKFINTDSQTYFPKKIISRIYLKALQKRDNPEAFVQIQMKKLSSYQQQIIERRSIRNRMSELFEYNMCSKFNVFGCAGFLSKVLKNFPSQLIAFNKNIIKEDYQNCDKRVLEANFQSYFQKFIKIPNTKIQFKMNDDKTEQFIFYQKSNYSNLYKNKKNNQSKIGQCMYLLDYHQFNKNQQKIEIKTNSQIETIIVKYIKILQNKNKIIFKQERINKKQKKYLIYFL